jgi:serine phosphatase RsbU (regulator of sigma subunit)
VRTNAYDICLFDCRLGARSGIELLREAQSAGCTAPIIMLTGQNDLEIDMEAMKSGAADYLVKGHINASMLDRSIRYTLDRAKTLRELRESRESLHQANVKLERMIEETNEDLEMARVVQLSLLPRSLDGMPGVRIYPVYQPSKAIGGDLYDVVLVADHVVALLMFDVAGHGVEAALYAAIAKVTFFRYIKEGASPRDVLYQVNRDLLKILGKGKYLTAFLCFIDARTLTLTYSAAAHPSPILFHKLTGATELLSAKGSLLGMFDEETDLARYENAVASLAIGDKLIIFTDGLPEGLNPQGKPIGKKAIETLFRGLSHLPLESIAAEILNSLNAHVGSLQRNDDLTFLLVEMA